VSGGGAGLGDRAADIQAGNVKVFLKLPKIRTENLDVRSSVQARMCNELAHSESRIPELKISLAMTVPNGLGTREYASIICSDVAWKRSSGPVVPAASRLMTARTLEADGSWVEYR